MHPAEIFFVSSGRPHSCIRVSGVHRCASSYHQPLSAPSSSSALGMLQYHRPWWMQEQLSAEAGVICLLAKLDPEALTVTSASPARSAANGSGNGAAGGSGVEGQIALVVQEGLEVRLPMAGEHPLQRLGLCL